MSDVFWSGGGSGTSRRRAGAGEGDAVMSWSGWLSCTPPHHGTDPRQSEGEFMAPHSSDTHFPASPGPNFVFSLYHNW